MPKTLILVRHGESEGNIIQRRIKNEGLTIFPENFKNTPDREIRLSPAGVIQTKLTADFLKKEYPSGMDVIYTSDHTRAKETAALVCLQSGWPDVNIKVDPQFGERNWGSFIDLDHNQRREIFKLKKRDPLHLPMPNGETLLEARARTRILLERCARQYEGKNVLVFSHGEYIECLWSEALHLRSEESIALFASPEGDIKNCQIVEFRSNDVGKFSSMRSSNPHLGMYGKWIDIVKKTFTPAELLKEVEKYPSILESAVDEDKT